MKEAEELGQFLQAAGVRHLLASPLERAWRTACIAGKIAGGTVELNQDLAEWRMEETEQVVQQRVQRALDLACQLSAQRGPVALVSHGAPVLHMVKLVGFAPAEIEQHRIYDSRNLIPPAGAWEVQPGLVRLAFVPAGVRWPAARSAPAYL